MNILVSWHPLSSEQDVRHLQLKVLTFLPAPHRDHVLRFHANRQQELSCGTEVHVANTFGVGTAENGQCLLRHSVPHVDGRGQTWE